MATATQLREAFVKELHREGMKFELLSEEENIVVVPVKTRGAKFIVFVDFDEDGDEADTVNFVEPSIARVVDAAKIPEIIVKLNQVNSDYRFAKCYLNDARDRVACDYNLIVDERLLRQPLYRGTGRFGEDVVGDGFARGPAALRVEAWRSRTLRACSSRNIYSLRVAHAS